MKRVLAWFAAASSLLVVAPAAVGQTTPPPTTTFVAVDAVKVDHTRIVVTGVLEGEATAVDREFYFTFSAYSTSQPYEQRQSCERLALVAMAKPGFYTFSVTQGSSSGYPSCTLARVTP
jgi:hypothetical protein